MGARQVGGQRRMALDRNVKEPSTAVPVTAPGVPGGEEVVAQAKTRFEDREAAAPGPALRQLIAPQENVARLFQRPHARVVGIAEQPRKGQLAELDLGRLDRLGLHAGWAL